MVLDLNMRMPSLDKKLGLDNSKGMSSYLENHTELDEVLLKTEQGFDVILSGPISEGSYELMMSEKFSLLLDSLKESYDYVLILSPQVGIVADALLLIRMSDLNLFIFRAQYSKRSFVQIIDRFINEHHIDNSGIILNGLELNKIRPWQKKSN
jgi:Mrp family chromosome partitioning ATPase